MKTSVVFLLLCHVSSAVKHSLKYFLTASSGVPNFPEFVGAAMVDGVQVGYCDSDMKTAEPKHDWMRKLIKDDPKHLEWYTQKCYGNQHIFRANIDGLKQRLNQSEGAHILQRMNGCEWDDQTGETAGFNQYGYDGEDFIALDLQLMTWTTPKHQAFTTKLRWDTETARLKYNKYYYMHMCPDWLKKYVHYERSHLQRTELPSVSLLQKSPSSPVTCHTTGFYPGRAAMFWTKDGEELFEETDYREILPNADGTFQMSVELNISLVKTEDWRRYECVFQLSGVEEDIVTKLDKAAIRSNKVPGSSSEFPAGLVSGVIIGLLLLSGGITGLYFWRKYRNGFQPADRQ